MDTPLYRYNSETGDFFKLCVKVGHGYSGFGMYRDCPDAEHLRALGPIPRGKYLIGVPHHSKKVGPVAMFLVPLGHAAHGRTALMIHGDNRDHTASRGCIILPRTVRDEIAAEVRRAPTSAVLEVFTSDRVPPCRGSRD